MEMRNFTIPRLARRPFATSMGEIYQAFGEEMQPRAAQ